MPAKRTTKSSSKSRRKTKVKSKPKPKTRPKLKPTSTALVRQRLARPASLVVPSVADSRAMAEVPDLAMVGGFDLRLTKREEQALRRPVNDDDVAMRFDGVVYLEHPACTRWLNDAFGALGWSLTPAAKPMFKDGQIMVWYRAAVHGHPVLLVLGDLPYRETNPMMTYGKAVEGTNQIALRRFCKRLGVGGELWRKRWIARFSGAHALRVNVREKVNGEWREVARWRRKDDPPLPREVGVSPDQHPPVYSDDQGGYGDPASSGNHGGYDRSGDRRVISAPQLKRLKTIAAQLKRKASTIKAWVFKRYGYEHSCDIQRRHYDAIVGAIEKNEYPDA